MRISDWSSDVCSSDLCCVNSFVIAMVWSMTCGNGSINPRTNAGRHRPEGSACWRDLALPNPNAGSLVACSDAQTNDRKDQSPLQTSHSEKSSVTTPAPELNGLPQCTKVRDGV